MAWSFWWPALIQEATKSHLIRTTDTVFTQEIVRKVGAVCQEWGQRPNVGPKDDPSALITEEIAGDLGALCLCQELAAETSFHSYK